LQLDQENARIRSLTVRADEAFAPDLDCRQQEGCKMKVQTQARQYEQSQQDARETAGNGTVAAGGAASLFSGALSIALCCIL
jgi:hypothetical protein